jgi:integrase/recombinase XerC
MGGSVEKLRLVLPSSGEAMKLPEDAEQLWQLFLLDKADLTRENYSSDLRCFARFLGCSDVGEAIETFLRCTPPEAHKTIIAYQGHLQNVRFYRREDDPETAKPIQIGYAAATINRRIYAIRAVVDLANICGLVPWKLQLKLRRPKTVQNVTGCGPEGYAALLATVDQAVDTAREEEDDRSLEVALRDRVLLRLLHDSGLRRKETVGIEWPLGVILDDKPRVFILGKGRRRQEWRPISSPCAEAIKSYLSVRGTQRGFLLVSTHPSHKGRKLNVSTVNRRVTYWSKRAQAPVTPHGLRHTATTSVLDLVEGDFREATQWSRHENPESLRDYDDARRDDARRLTEAISDPTGARPHQEE